MLNKLNNEGALALLEVIFTGCAFNDVVRWNQELNVLEYRNGVSVKRIADVLQQDSRTWAPVKYFGRLREL